MKDEVFGTLTKRAHQNVLEGKASLDYIGRFGAALDLRSEESEGAPSVDLIIDIPRSTARPSKSQQDAWTGLLAGGDSLWDEILEQVLMLYNRQRPIRARVWKATFGDVGLARCLPEITTTHDLAPLVLPMICRIKLPSAKDQPPEIGIHFAATWHNDGFGVLIPHQKVIQVGHISLVHPFLKVPHQHMLQHQVFGALGRPPAFPLIESETTESRPPPWEGLTRCDPFLDYCLVALNRAKFIRQPPKAGNLRLSLAWEFADGQFEIRVYTGSDEAPTELQARAWASFRAEESHFVAELVQTIFQMYQEVCPIRRRLNAGDEDVNELIPILTNPQGLRELMQMRCIHVHPAVDGKVTLAFQFVTSWDYDGLTAFWRDGQVYNWGVWNDAKPPAI